MKKIISTLIVVVLCGLISVFAIWYRMVYTPQTLKAAPVAIVSDSSFIEDAEPKSLIVAAEPEVATPKVNVPKVAAKSETASAMKPEVSSSKIKAVNICKNGQFKDNLKEWSQWKGEKDLKGIEWQKSTVRISNPNKILIGLNQPIKVVSNTVYRISGNARTFGKIQREKLFGARIAFYLPGQKEKQMVWMNQNNDWSKKEYVFTNQVTGTGTLYFHMGYGNVAATGEFRNIKFEQLLP